MRVIRRVYNTSAFQSYDIEVPAVGTGSTSMYIISWYNMCLISWHNMCLIFVYSFKDVAHDTPNLANVLARRDGRYTEGYTAICSGDRNST